MEKTPIKPPSVHQTTPDQRPTAQSFSSGSSTTKPMSASLRERLKRTRRPFRSPFSVVKRLKIEDEEPQTSQPEDANLNVTENREIDTDVNQNMKEQRDSLIAEPEKDLNHMCEQLRREVKEKSETLRRLKMVKMYRQKNDLTQLQMLIGKWRSCAQDVLYELQGELQTEGQKMCLSQLIDNFGLDDTILHFDRTEEEFTDT